MSKKKQKLYQAEFKARIALESLREEKTLAQISGEHDMHVYLKVIGLRKFV